MEDLNKSSAKAEEGLSLASILGRFDRFSESGARRFARHFPFVMLLFVLGTIHIANNHFAENMARRTINLEKEVKTLRWDYLSRSSELMIKSRQSEVAEAAAIKELHELRQPPVKIVVPPGE
jgi:hypothetical protein